MRKFLKTPWRIGLLSAVAMGGALTVLTTLSPGGTGTHMASASANGSMTKGTIPPSAWQSNGEINLSKVPDFVATLGPNGQTVGYIPREELFPKPPISQNPNTEQPPGTQSVRQPTAADQRAQEQSLVKTVYSSDLTTVVGHMYPGVGFVPIGVSPPLSSTPPTTVAN